MNLRRFDFPESLSTLVEVVRWRAAAHPTRHAFTHLVDGERVGDVVTYAELDQRARAIAGVLQDRAAGAPVLLCYPSGLEFVAAFLGCFYAGALAIPAYSPSNRRHVARIRAIVADSRASLVLSAGSSVDDMRAWLPEHGDGGAVEVIDSRLITPDAADAWRPKASAPEDLAYLQYTSGSTSTPRGVMVSQENLLRNGDAICDGFALHPDSLTVSWLPLFHDMGLVLTLVAPLLTGTSVVMMTPAAFVQRPLRWLEAVSRFRATHSGGPNFAFDLAVDRTTPAQREQLDLSAWETSYNGSEPVRKSTLERFSAAFAVSGFSPRTHVPAYGLAEATLLVTSKRTRAEVETRALRSEDLQKHRVAFAKPLEGGVIDIVGCGPPVVDTTIEVVDPQTRLPAPPGSVGELWVRAPGVALGYWKNTQATEDVFRARLADSGDGPFLRTGDLGFFDGGQLYVAGRIKDVIILRGRNHYPHDIELTVQESHPSLERGNGAAFGVTRGGEERLVIVQEVSRTALRSFEAEAVLTAIQHAVTAEHEVEIHDLLLVAPLEVPKTSSGKIQHFEARERYLEDALKVLARWRAPSASEPLSPAGSERGPVPNKAHEERQRAIEQWMTARLAGIRGVAPADIDVARPFQSFGIDSILAVRLSGELQDWLGVSLPATLLYEYPDIRNLSRYLAGAATDARTGRDDGKVHEPVAIVGIGCRFPGASTPDEFWEQLRRGAGQIDDAPPERWERGSVSLGEPGTPGRISSQRGGFVSGVDLFDADFFGISPREAVDIDPQQRMLLEVAWSALEDAAIAPTKLAGTHTGVFVGVSTRDYADILAGGGAAGFTPYFGTGTAASGAAGRLSYVLGLEGPSLVVDTACSSSLVAIHLAAQSLRSGECSTALAGGVNLVLSPSLGVALSQARMLSPTGLCHTFDAAADGYVRGEGCGVVVLKRLRDAIADGDRVLAVIRGTAVNHDGRTNGLTAPSARAQERVVRAALGAADVRPEEVGYIEAHGTGTPLGDPIEVEALTRVFGEQPPGRAPAYLGSVKTNIGHLEAAAGIAGVIKVVLSLQHGEVPAHLHLERPNPLIAWDKIPFRVPLGTSPWPGDRGRRVAGVSSFGFVGTNAHVVLEAALAQNRTAEVGSPDARSHLLCLSAHTPDALDHVIAQYASLLGTPDAPALGDVCAAAATGRAHLRHRAALVADSAADLREALHAADGIDPQVLRAAWRVHRSPRALGAAARVVFLFTGQGAQYAGMAKGLYQRQAAFRRALDRCAAAFEPHLSAPLLSFMHPENGDDARIDQTEFSQPALFAVEWALVEMWRAWGVTPSALIGHSIGEYVAACAAGVFSLEDAAALVAARARAMQKVTAVGAMVAVAANEAAVLEAIARDSAAVSIAAVNAPLQCIVSGDRNAVSGVTRRLEAQGIACEPLNVSHAFHSPLMTPALEEIDRALERVRFHAPQLPFFANLHGREAAPGDVDTPDYWRRQVIGTIRFGDCVKAALDGGYTTFLDIGPQPTLTALAQQTMGARAGTCAASLRRRVDDERQVAEALAVLYAGGVDIDWDAVYRERPHIKITLPGYPFQRQRFWTDVAAHAARPGEATAVVASDGRHALLGDRLPLGSPHQRAWIQRVDLASMPWLSDHQVDAALVYPGTGFIEAGSVAAREVFGTHAIELADIAFERPLVSDPIRPRELQTHAAREGDSASVVLYSRAAGESEWVRHCSMRAAASTTSDALSALEPIAAITARCTQPITPAAFYERWRARGNHWGGAFQGIVQLAVGPGEAIARIEVPAAVAAACDAHPAHPALLDACVQALAATLIDGTEGAFVGQSVGMVRLYAPLGTSPLWSHCVLRNGETSRSRTICGDVRVRDESGRLVAELLDVRFRFIDFAGAASPGRERWLHATEWVVVEPAAENRPTSEWAIVHAGEGRAAERLANSLTARGHQARVVDAGDGPDDTDGVAARLMEVIAVARQLAQRGTGSLSRLAILTRGACALPGDAHPASLLGAASWGLGRTMAAEHQELSTTLIDLDPTQVESGIDVIAAQLCSASTEDQLAARGAQLFAPRLTETAVGDAIVPRVRPECTYVITGGLGALGLRVARWLAERGCRHLVLMSRTPLPPRSDWHDADPASDVGRRIAAIVAIEALGARVSAAVVDVADEKALAAWHTHHRRGMYPPVRGVVHAAGMVRLSPSLGLTRDTLREHLAAKLFGARALDRLFADDALDAFVLFSSASAVLGSPGLAAYAAANSGLDALASARRARGGNAISIQWGAWAGGGLARDAIEEAGGARAAETIDPEQGLQILGELWSASSPVVAVLPIDWQSWNARNATLAQAPVLSRLMQPQQAQLRDVPDRAELMAADPADRRACLMRWVARQAADVLRVAEATLEPHAPLTGFGLDSLMALEIRNRVREGLDVAISLVELIRGATLEQVVREIESALGAYPTVTLVPVPVAEIEAQAWPLSQGQRALWLLHSLQPESASYHVAFSARVTSPVNVAAMRRAWNALRERHAMLRSQWSADGGELAQRVRTSFADTFETAVAADEPALEHGALEAYRRPFDLEHGEPARLHLLTRSETNHVLLFVAHHIACDGWSLWIVIEELKQLYAAECAGRHATLAPSTHGYIDFVKAEQALLQGAEGERQWQHWRSRLSGELPTLDLPTDRPRTSTASVRGASHVLTLPPALRDGIARLAQDRGVTVFTVLAAGFTALLHRYTGQDDILIGMPAAGRTNGVFAGVVGHFVNEVVLRSDLSGEPTFATVLGRTRDAVLDAMAAQDFPFPELVHRLCPERDPRRSPLFQVNFVFQKAQQAGEILDLMSGTADAAIEWGGLKLRPHVLHQQEGQFDLTLEMLDTGATLSGAFKYNPDLFDAETMARLDAHYQNLLASAVRHPDRLVSDLDVLSDTERSRQLAGWSGGTGAWPATSCVHQRFEQAARRAPDAVAIVCDDKQITYRDLDHNASRLAAELRRNGAGPEVLVALFFDPCIEMITAILAVLKAGAAYLPLPASAPDDRLAYMLEDSRAQLLVTGRQRGNRLRGYAGTVIDVDALTLEGDAVAEVDATASPSNIAYCIYTSGTTGRPKGVLVEHRQVTRLFDATQSWFSFDARDVWTLFHSYAFDFSVWEIWGALLHGGRLVIVPPTVSRSPDAFHALAAEQGITVLNQTPSAFREFIAADERAGADALPALRLVIFGGEALDAAMLEPWIARHGTMPRLVNMYGITETTVHVTYAPVDTAISDGVSRIGVPIPDLQTYVLDGRMQPVPVGVRGELYVGGAGVVRGYLGRPGLTADRFVPHPFSAAPGARLYRTGDVGRYRTDGTIEYLGRIDRQVKIRGYRIEQGEIEAMLRACEGVRDAIVVPRQGAGGEPALFAYVLRAAGASPAAETLRAQLRATLPDYMVPATIHVLDAFPYTSNGKIDDRALSQLGISADRDAERVMPSSLTERTVATVWRDVLGIDEIGLHDNFFDLGGHSLLVPRVHRRLQDEFRTRLSIVDLFRHPSVADLAAHLEGVGSGSESLDESEKRAQLRQARRGRARGRVIS